MQIYRLSARCAGLCGNLRARRRAYFEERPHGAGCDRNAFGVRRPSRPLNQANRGLRRNQRRGRGLPRRSRNAAKRV